MITRSFYVQILALLFCACSSSTDEHQTPSQSLTPEQQKLNNLEQQVLHLHDEVMPLMADLVDLKGKLQRRNKELQASEESGAQDQAIINQMIISNLDVAHESMMDWMRNYQKIDIAADISENMRYLEEEKSKINLVTEQIFSAIAAAKEALDASDQSN